MCRFVFANFCVEGIPSSFTYLIVIVIVIIIIIIIIIIVIVKALNS